jgi:hypothetical protein
MFTLELTTFRTEQQEPKQECIDFIAMNAGDANRVVVRLRWFIEDELFCSKCRFPTKWKILPYA